MASVHIIQGPDKGNVIEIPAKGCILGRGSGTIQLRDPTISRNHSSIHIKEKTFYINDFGSANGTFVNGVRIAKDFPLKYGDHIRVGKTVLVFSEDQPIEIPLDETQFDDLIDLDEKGKLVDSAIMAALPSNQKVLIAPTEPHQANKHLRVLYDLVMAIGSTFNIEQLLNRVMELIFNELPADRGFVLLADEQTGKLEPVVVKYRNPVQEKRITTSNTIINHVMKKRQALLCTNAMTDKRFSKEQSVYGYRIRSVICAPIIARDLILGIIHIDSSAADCSYDKNQLHLLTAIGFQAGLAIRNVQLYHESIKAEKLAATGQTVASLSHYIKNILQGLQGGADTVELGIRSTNIKTTETGWQIVSHNLDKIQNLMLNMLAFSKDRQPRLGMIQINSVVEEVLDLTRKPADNKGVMLITDLSENIPAIPIDPDGIHQVILNIVNNALETVPQNTGAVTIKTSFDEETNQAIITVGDNGYGIPDDQMDKIFEVFHSTKGHGGTGLGLAVARKIIDEHNGKINVVSHTDGGTIFTVKLPGEQPKHTSSEKTNGVGTH